MNHHRVSPPVSAGSSRRLESDEIDIQRIPHRNRLSDDLRPSRTTVTWTLENRYSQTVSGDAFRRYRSNRRRKEDLRTVADRLVTPLYGCPDSAVAPTLSMETRSGKADRRTVRARSSSDVGDTENAQLHTMQAARGQSSRANSAISLKIAALQ